MLIILCIVAELDLALHKLFCTSYYTVPRQCFARSRLKPGVRLNFPTFQAMWFVHPTLHPNFSSNVHMCVQSTCGVGKPC